MPIISYVTAIDLADSLTEEELKGAIILKEKKIKTIIKNGKKDKVQIVSHEIAQTAPIAHIKDSIAIKESVFEELKKTKKRLKVSTGLPAFLIEGDDALEHSNVANRVMKNAIIVTDDSETPLKENSAIIDGITTPKKAEIVPES